MEEISIFTANKIIERAFQFKTDLSGKPYIGHLKRVAGSVGACVDLHIIALLHDLLEDCPEWNEKSLRTFFSDRIVDEVVTLTRLSDETYEQYIKRISESSWATQVKIADLKDNMDVTRLPELTDNNIKRLKKYHKAYLCLITE